jgi:hypothetical protein
MRRVLLSLVVLAAAGLTTSAALADDGMVVQYGMGGPAVYPVHHYVYGYGPVYARPRVWCPPPVIVPVPPPPPVLYPPAYVAPRYYYRDYYYRAPGIRYYGPRFSIGVEF